MFFCLKGLKDQILNKVQKVVSLTGTYYVLFVKSLLKQKYNILQFKYQD